MIQTYGMLELVQHVTEAATRRVTRAAAMSQPSRSTMTERRFARIAFWNGRKVMRMTTNPHPTPEERVEATLNDWRKDAGDLRIHFANAIREAEAAGEVKSDKVLIRALASLAAAISLLERVPKAKKAAPSDKMFEQMLSDYRNALEAGRTFIRARTDKESSND